MSHPGSQKPFKINAVDLFCGAGGLTCGLRQAGINVKAGIDVEKRCEYAYSHNNHAEFVEKSVADIKGEDLARYGEGADFTLLAGCAPCQAFSNYNRKADSSDKRWNLLDQFGRLVKETLPAFVTMENVPQITVKGGRVFQGFISLLSSLGYFLDWKVVKCQEYGLPQSRQRLVLLASRLGPIHVLSPQEFGAKPKSVRDAIAGLPKLEAGETCPTDRLHRCATLSPINKARIRASKPGSTWKDWPEDLRCLCHKKESGSTYKNVYGRMSWDEPSPTMTTQFHGYGTGRFGHPEQDRAISLREGAILQSFPADYQFVDPKTPIEISTIARMIGNAVPVMIGELIGKSIFQHLQDQPLALNA